MHFEHRRSSSILWLSCTLVEDGGYVFSSSAARAHHHNRISVRKAHRPRNSLDSDPDFRKSRQYVHAELSFLRSALQYAGVDPKNFSCDMLALELLDLRLAQQRSVSTV
eukprot:18440-Heterococcus_DN1.PRE.1